MRISSRSKLRLSIIGALALVFSLAGAAAPSGVVAKAAPGVTSASYMGKAGKVIRLASSKGVFTGHMASAKTQQPDRSIPYRTPGGHNAFQRAAPRPGTGVPQVSGSAVAGRTPEGRLRHNFNGVSSADSFAVNGFQDTPPDQGLCVGFLGSNKVVLEIVNSAATFYTTSGTALVGPVNLAVAFQDPNAFSDPRCFFDTATHTFFLAVISFDNTGNTVTDVEVINGRGATTYQFSSSEGGTCFGDQPHVGYDSHALYVATDQFCGPQQNVYEGALLIGISKPQLVAQAASVNFVTFGPVSLGGVPILTLEPAFGNASGTEYLLNSFPFDQFGNNNSIANTLGFWSVTGDSAITSGSGKVKLTGQIISSETYAFPMPAASTGTGAITCVPGNHPLPPCSPLEPILSEPFLNPDDSRMLQVQLVNDDRHGLQLYAALSSAVTIRGDPSARDGAAWFVLDPKHHKITDQGYVAVKGAYLLYPAILHTHEGTTAMAFTITSPILNPSTAYVVRKSTSHSFGSVTITALGTGPHLSFAGPVFGSPRWGDYSAEELDPNGVDIWSASEYIPPPADQASRDNWGTEVWDVAGDH